MDAPSQRAACALLPEAGAVAKDDGIIDEATKAQNLPQVQLADLKIGDTILVGYDAEAKMNHLHAAVAIEPTKNANQDPLQK